MLTGMSEDLAKIEHRVDTAIAAMAKSFRDELRAWEDGHLGEANGVKFARCKTHGAFSLPMYGLRSLTSF